MTKESAKGGLGAIIVLALSLLLSNLFLENVAPLWLFLVVQAAYYLLCLLWLKRQEGKNTIKLKNGYSAKISPEVREKYQGDFEEFEEMAVLWQEVINKRG